MEFLLLGFFTSLSLILAIGAHYLTHNTKEEGGNWDSVWKNT